MWHQNSVSVFLFEIRVKVLRNDLRFLYNKFAGTLRQMSERIKRFES